MLARNINLVVELLICYRSLYQLVDIRQSKNSDTIRRRLKEVAVDIENLYIGHGRLKEPSLKRHPGSSNHMRSLLPLKIYWSLP